MALPVFRRYSIADMPTAPNWVNNLLNPLNVFSDGVIQSLGNLSIGENVQGMKYKTSFFTPTDYSSGGFTPINFAYTGKGTPTCILIGHLMPTDGTVNISPFSITQQTINLNVKPIQITIAYIAGLNTNVTYEVSFVVL